MKEKYKKRLQQEIGVNLKGNFVDGDRRSPAKNCRPLEMAPPGPDVLS